MCGVRIWRYSMCSLLNKHMLYYSFTLYAYLSASCHPYSSNYPRNSSISFSTLPQDTKSPSFFPLTSFKRYTNPLSKPLYFSTTFSLFLFILSFIYFFSYCCALVNAKTSLLNIYDGGVNCYDDWLYLLSVLIRLPLQLNISFFKEAKYSLYNVFSLCPQHGLNYQQ